MNQMDCRLTVTLDRGAREALRTLAEVRAEGNQSLLLRQLLKQEAAKLTERKETESGVRHA